MPQIEIRPHESLTPQAVLAGVEKCVVDSGLTVTLRDTLLTYPGSTHWHLKDGRQPGVLEITYWPDAHRLWFSVHHNRNAPWIDRLLPTLYNQLKALSEQGATIPQSS